MARVIGIGYQDFADLIDSGCFYVDKTEFIRALLLGNMKEMNAYMNRIALAAFSYFDTGNRLSGAEPERFYHGFVLGLMVELADRYVITSNRESGFGRYDVMLKPRKDEDDAVILEFKMHDADEETDLQDTVNAALRQIEAMNYKEALIAEGISEERIRAYGFGFEGKRVLIGQAGCEERERGRWRRRPFHDFKPPRPQTFTKKPVIAMILLIHILME